MIVEVVAVGTELLLGQILNSNATWLGGRLAEEGWDANHQQVVGDNRVRLAEAIRLAMSRADAVVVTGGIGPTQDDLTREAIAEATGRPLLFNDAYAERLGTWWFERTGKEMPASNFRQAEYPEGAIQYDNPKGTAPGLGLDHDGTWLFALPGVPAEMEYLFDTHVVPRIRTIAGDFGVLVSKLLQSWGMSESGLSEQLDDLYHGSVNPSLAFLASDAVIKIRITAKGRTEDEARALIAPVEAEVHRRLGRAIFAEDGDTIQAVVLRLCREREWTLATAESMTAGMVAARVTTVPGASEVFVGGVVAYTAETKAELLDVAAALIEAAGLVSEEVALAMAVGARAKLGADVAVAVTGAAGPGSHDGTEPGTVVIAVVTPDGAKARVLRMPGDRERSRVFSVTAALQHVRLALLGEWW